MTASAGSPGAGPFSDNGDAEQEETQLGQPAALRNCFSSPGISVLEKLIKTCPVWLQLCISQERAADVICKEPAGIFMVRKDENLKNLFLSVHFPAQAEASEVLEYKIKEEKSLLYLEGSLLVFEDIFKLVAFYCVSRDLLPFTLRLPQAILEADTVTDLETISSLGIAAGSPGLSSQEIPAKNKEIWNMQFFRAHRVSHIFSLTSFWDSSLNRRRRGRFPHSVKGPAFTAAQAKKGKKPSQCFASSTNNCSCEIELSLGNDRLWFVNPIFIEERSNPFPVDVPPPASCRESPPPRDIMTKPLKKTPSRPAPPPPPPLSPHAVKQPKKSPICLLSSGEGQVQELAKTKKEMKAEICTEKEGGGPDPTFPGVTSPANSRKSVPPLIPPRRCLSERAPGKDCLDKSRKCSLPGGELAERPSAGTEIPSDDCQHIEPPQVTEGITKDQLSQHPEAKPEKEENMMELKPTKEPPIPPPRKKRLSRQPSSANSCHSKQTIIEELEECSLEKQDTPPVKACSNAKKESTSGRKPFALSVRQSSRDSLDCPVSNTGAQTPASEPDSYSTSSTEDESEHVISPSVKKTRSMILGRAKSRLSMVSLSNVFMAFLSADRKLQKKIVELAQDKESYFGNLVQDYKVYSLEMMARQSSSTETLQEIRLMMTQLKSYLIQSTELKSFVDQAVHTEEQLEVIIEAALHKCVLKPLKEAIDTYLREIHTKDGSFQLLKENQQVIQNTTTTDLGVTTSVPETALLEKILHKFTNMHKAYSPEKKIRILLKSCKLIYDSMSQGQPGKPYGADDFLPVLLYVLARSDLTEMLLNVEYMMELMDPALQLGEGSYYLITTYGAVELIKSYDKITVTRQLSTEVQDSIHRWERRRTLNKAQASRSSVQDFITISFMEADSQTRTLAYRTDSTTQSLNQQCAEKFDVSEPQDFGLFILIDNKSLQLDNEALPYRIKSHFLNKDPKSTFHFIYKQIGGEETSVPIIKEADDV